MNRRGIKIKTQLIIGFIIPILFVAGIGTYSYITASNGMQEKFQESTVQAISMAAKLVDFGLETIDATSGQLQENDSVKKYVKGKYADDVKEQNNAYFAIYSDINLKKGSDSFISNIYIIAPDDATSIATVGKYGEVKNIFNKSVYDQLIEDFGDDLRAEDDVAWVDYHSTIDTVFNVEPESYVLSVMREIPYRSGIAVIDIDAERIRQILNDLELGEGSVVAFVTPNDSEIRSTDSKEITFADKYYYYNCLNTEENDISEFVNIGKTRYLYMYSRCGTNGSAICALVPESELVKEAKQLGEIIIVLTILAAAVLAIIAVFIIRNIASSIGVITGKLKQVSAGDMTVEIDMAANTEFGIVSQHIMETVGNTKEMITKVIGVATTVSESVDRAGDAADTLQATSEGIKHATEEINLGINQQVDDAESCLNMMDELSKSILHTDERIDEMSKAVEQSREMIEQGTKVMKDLDDRARQTGEISNLLSAKIEELTRSSKQIEHFVNVINEIAEETTLLSLNASIEAARAGEAGRGFAVVADEIKKLAESSLQASDEVSNVVKIILGMTEETRAYSQQTLDSVEAQTQTVEDTLEIFDSINERVSGLAKDIADIDKDMQEINADRKGTLEAISSISGVTQETAASTESVSDAVGRQLQQVIKLTEITNELDELTGILQETVSKFTV